MNENYYNIKPAGRHVFTIGQDLIKDNYTAVIELIKNSYDADASYVNLEFIKYNDNEFFKIIIEDNGHGMSKDDVINKWLVPSTENKKLRKMSPKGRILQGSKGIGRYAVNILGHKTILETVDENRVETKLEINWNEFLDAKYLEDVTIKIESKKVSKDPGTKLTIIGDKEYLNNWEVNNWEVNNIQNPIDNLKLEIVKFLPPIEMSKNNDKFSVFIKTVGFGEHDNEFEEIKPFPFIDVYHYKISGYIDDSGKSFINYINNKGDIRYEEEISLNELSYKLDGNKIYNLGKIYFDFKIYDRDDIDTLINLHMKYGELEQKISNYEMRRILNNHVGVRIYRNSFRIRPLGEPGNDWLKLDKRRVQNPSLRIGVNQIIGFINIESEDKTGLIEKTARDGLKENRSFYQLKDLILSILSLAEERRFKYRRNTNKNEVDKLLNDNIYNLYSENAQKGVINILKKEGIDESTVMKINEIFNKDNEIKIKAVKEIEKSVAQYQDQATLGRIVHVILHEAKRPVGDTKAQSDLLNSNIKYGLKSMEEENFEGMREDLNEAKKNADNIEKNSIALRDIFKRIEPLAQVKRGPKENINVKLVINQSLNIFKEELNKNNISVKIEGNENLRIIGWRQDIYTIFVNLIENSIYWLNKKNFNDKKININIIGNDNNWKIIYKDNGPGISKQYIESNEIFIPNFTTKKDEKAMGLGLPISGEAAKRSGLSLIVKESNIGAEFEISEEKSEK